MDNYRELKVWQLGMDLTEEVYALTRDFPKSEQFGLVNQMRRATVSIPANIAEGHARDSTRDYLRHLSIARGSLAEAETFTLLAPRLKFVKPPQCDRLLKQMDQLSRMLRSLQTSLRKKLEE